MENPFSKELWQRRAEEEGGVKSKKDQAFDLLFEIRSGSVKTEDLKELYNDLEDVIIRYNHLIEKMEKTREESPAAVQEIWDLDESRRRAHDALIGYLNAISRLFAKEGLSNSWRQKIGEQRQDVTEWARNIADFVEKDHDQRKKESEQNKLSEVRRFINFR